MPQTDFINIYMNGVYRHSSNLPSLCCQVSGNTYFPRLSPHLQGISYHAFPGSTTIYKYGGHTYALFEQIEKRELLARYKARQSQMI